MVENEQEKSYQEIRKDLFEKYKEEVVPRLADYEQKRKSETNSSKNSGKKFFKWFFIIVGSYYIGIILFATILSIILLLSGYKNIIQFIWAFAGILGIAPLSIIMIILMISPFIWLISYGNKAYNFQQEVKNYVMPLVCTCFTSLKWVPDRNHSTESYENSKVIHSFDSVNYDDCFEGSYKGIDFVVEEICASRRGGKTSTIVFDGVIIQFKINKKFKGHTIIRPVEYRILSPVNPLHRTKMEDIIFEKEYNVYTNDDTEARYLVTPLLMEKISSIKTTFNAQKVYSSFYKGVFYLGLCTCKNMFDYGSIINSMTDPKPFLEMAEEIISILKLIDYFKLHQNIGM